MDFESLDWTRLDRLRSTFLAERVGAGAYWQDERDLELYDATFGERIGWKWDSVIRELQALGWAPPAGCELWDWGCGSGVAGRRVLSAWPGRFRAIRLTDQSSAAVSFAERRARELAPDLPIAVQTLPAGSAPVPYILCLSHVWNELPDLVREELLTLAASAEAVLWVEPGNHGSARGLQEIRSHLIRRGLRVAAPCTHGARCGLLAPGNERHWCHHFADPPAGVHADSDWVRFAQRAGIDLRALPYSFLVFERHSEGSGGAESATGNWHRLLGTPRVYKGFARAQLCGPDGVVEWEVPKRIAPSIHKAWEKGRGGVLYRVLGEDGRVRRLDVPELPSSPGEPDPAAGGDPGDSKETMGS